MDSHRAISVLREVIRLRPGYVEPHYRLAHELYALGRYAEAKTSVEQVITLVAAPGEDVSPKLLARYYYYLGRILEASGDHRSAASQYRRAADYDPAYAEPILALAKRSAVSGDLAAAQTTLINAAHQAIEAAGKTAAVPMQRGLARLQLASGDPSGAIDAYRGMLAVNPEDIADRVALSELYVYQDLRKAIRELLRVIDRDIRVGPVYKQLADYYSRAGKKERVYRVQSIMEALGFADKQDMAQLSRARSKHRSSELIYPIDDEVRRKLLLTDAGRSLQGELLAAMEAELAGVFPTPPLGENLQPALHGGGDRKVRKILSEAIALFGIEPEVYLGEDVPGGMVVMSAPRAILVLDHNMVAEGELALRFLLGYGFEAIRGKFALLLMLSQRQLSELYALLGPLVKTTSARAIKKSPFVASLSKRAHKLIDRIGESDEHIPAEDWIAGMIASARRAGLLLCDDFSAATRVIARLSGESLGRGEGVSAGLGAVICGEDLVRFYLSDAYSQLRQVLSDSPG